MANDPPISQYWSPERSAVTPEVASAALQHGFEASNAAEDFDRLARRLRVLAYSKRLQILASLRTAQTIDELRIRPAPGRRRGEGGGRMSRQALQNHLDQLLAEGLVRVRPGLREGKRVMHEYVLDHARLYATIEEVRHACEFELESTVSPLQTEGRPAAADATLPTGPKLVTVKGLREGRVVSLADKQGDAVQRWLIGRAPECDVVLDYDICASAENAEVIKRDGSFVLLDLRTSRNGTKLNYRRLPVGAEHVLEHGDIIGIGRTTLVFRDH